MAQGIWEPKSNEELAAKVAALTKIVMARRAINWIHVYGHTGEHDNEIADQAADMGAEGRITDQSKRWTRAPPPLAGAEVPMDQCRKCGEEFPVCDIKWHFRRCTSTLWVIPEGKDKCRKCKEFVSYGRRTVHEKDCRGSVDANRTCEKCGEVYPVPKPPGLSRPMRCHEKLCNGVAKSVDRRGGAACSAKAQAKAKIRAKPAFNANYRKRLQTIAKSKGGASYNILRARPKGKSKAKAKPVMKRPTGSYSRFQPTN